MNMDTSNKVKLDLIRLFELLHAKRGVEIGVRGGDFSLLCMENVFDLEMFGVDPYMRLSGYRDITRAATFEKYEAEAHRKLDQFSKYHFIKETSEDALVLFEDESIDFVYIDGNHNYVNVMNDITEWTKKVKRGGVVCGDDYLRRKGQDMYYNVVSAVQDYCIENEIEFSVWREGDEIPQWVFLKP
jgi:hypothetical protein